MSKTGEAARILVVDDSEESSAITTALLRRGGFEQIEFARSGQEALECIGIDGETPPSIDWEIEYDLVILDIVMPDMDGIEVCARMRINQPSRHVPILMLTALRDVETLNQAFVAGADDFVTKPVDEIRLLARVRTLLRMRREQKRRQMREADLRLQNLNLQRGQLDAVLIEPITRLPRDLFVELILRNCREIDEPAALALIHIADFTLYRELHGNAAAEKLLHGIARILASIEAPLAAIPCAYGPGSFMVVQPGAASEDALTTMCNAVRAVVDQAAIHHGNSIRGENVTVLAHTSWGDSEELRTISERLLGRMKTRMAEVQT